MKNKDSTRYWFDEGPKAGVCKTEIARLGFLQDKKYEVVICTDDGGFLPHMHIWDYTTRGGKFHCCVRLDKAEYFKHTGKEDTLNSIIKKDLIAFLNSPSKYFETNWDGLLVLWNENNSEVELDLDIEMPDYTKL